MVDLSTFPWNASHTVSLSVFPSVYSHLKSCLARDKLPFFSTYFLSSCFGAFPALQRLTCLSSSSLSLCLICQVALDALCGAGFAYFGVFCVFPLFLDVRRS